MLENRATEQAEALKAAIASEPDDVHRIMRALGAEDVLGHVPHGLVETLTATSGPLDDEKTARLAFPSTAWTFFVSSERNLRMPACAHPLCGREVDELTSLFEL